MLIQHLYLNIQHAQKRDKQLIFWDCWALIGLYPQPSRIGYYIAFKIYCARWKSLFRNRFLFLCKAFCKTKKVLLSWFVNSR